MNRKTEGLPKLSPTVRVSCVIAAAVCAAAVNAGLLDLFDQASAQRWLQPTPQLLSAKAACDALPERSQRTQCAQSLVAHTLAAIDRPVRLAAR